MGILYYIPGARGEALDERAALGLDESLGRANVSARELALGPDGGAGILLARGDVSYRPEMQEWEEIAGAWLGRWKDVPIPPEDLLRPEPVGGWPVRLDDGNDWLVPVAIPQSDVCALPRVYRLEPDGSTREEVPAKYQALVKAAGKITAAMRAGLEAATSSRVEVEIPEPFDTAVEALRVNYRLGRREASFLGILTTENYMKVFAALVDWEAAQASAREEKEAVASGSA